VQRGDDGAFVTTGGFTNDVNASDGGEAFDQLGMTIGGVGEVKGFALEMELEGCLGDIQTRLDGGLFVIHNCGCVLTHSCGYELTSLRRRSGNGSSSGRISADGSGWASDSKVRGLNDHIRAAVPWPAGQGTDHLPVWLTPNKEDEKTTYKG
jgi:hypothetical protein